MVCRGGAARAEMDTMLTMRPPSTVAIVCCSGKGKEGDRPWVWVWIRKDALHEEEDGPGVEVDQAVPVVEGLLGQGLVDGQAGVVDQDVDGGPVPPHGGVYQLPRAVLRRQVRLDGDGGLSGGQGGGDAVCLVGQLGVGVVDDDAGASGRELLGDGGAYPRVGACHYGDLACEGLVWHGFRLGQSPFRDGVTDEPIVKPDAPSSWNRRPDVGVGVDLPVTQHTSQTPRIPGPPTASTASPNNRHSLRVRIDSLPQAPESADQRDRVGLVDGPRHCHELDEPLGVAGGLGSRPAEDQGDVVDKRGLGELAEGVLVVGDVDHSEEHTEVVPTLEVADARVDVFWVESVVFQTVEL
ncbi:hypothetical protein VM1G_11647 [Cytospora mali]|uniref:Uncharacterized protein n=1 Tax=Cytospora mali TaxID=578113 RepID=A0A194VZD0_CYTMA|nr:hypothetical protein VM1G_11647 [Valsa mali]